MYTEWVNKLEKYTDKAIDIAALYLMLTKVEYTIAWFELHWEPFGVQLDITCEFNDSTFTIKDYVSRELLEADQHLITLLVEELNEYPTARDRINRIKAA